MESVTLPHGELLRYCTLGQLFQILVFSNRCKGAAAMFGLLAETASVADRLCSSTQRPFKSNNSYVGQPASPKDDSQPLMFGHAEVMIRGWSCFSDWLQKGVNWQVRRA